MWAQRQKRCSTCNYLLFWVITKKCFFCPHCRTSTYLAVSDNGEEKYPANPKIYDTTDFDATIIHDERRYGERRYDRKTGRWRSIHIHKPNLALIERPRKEAMNEN